jgi:phosphatidylglycerol lysyltransferase
MGELLMPVYIKRSIQNAAIFLLVLIGMKNIFVALPFRYVAKLDHSYRYISSLESLFVHHLLSFLTGVLILLLAYHLFKRVRLAWIIGIIALVITLLIQFYHVHSFTMLSVVVELFILAVLLISYDDFSRKGDRITIKKAFLFAAAIGCEESLKIT